MLSVLRRSFGQRRGGASLAIGLLMLACTTALASTPGFTLPEDTALRIRLDDTITSVDSEVGDPFSATVVDQGEYRNARVYGHITQIEMSGRIKGSTSMMLRFDRLVMPDGRRTAIHAEIVELYHAPTGESVGVEGAIESGGRAEPPPLIRLLERGPALCLAASSGAVKGLESGLSSVAPADWGQRRSVDTRRSHSAADRKC